MNVFYTEMINKLLFDHNGVPRTAGELASLRSEISKFNNVVEKMFAPHCSSGLFTLKFHVLDHSVEDFQRFESFSFTDAAPFKNFNLLIKQSYRMSSRRYSTRMYERVHNIGRALKSVRREKSQVQRGVVGASVLKKRKSVEGGGGYLVRDGVCVALEQLAETAERTEAALTVEELFGGVLAGLRGEEGLVSFAKCVRKHMFVHRVRVFDGDVRIVFAKSKFIGGGFFPSLEDYDKTFHVIRASSVKGCVEREQKFYASPEFGAQRKWLNIFVLILEERDGREELWVGKELLLYRCSVKGESDGDELAFVRYIECMAPLDEVGEALKCVCLQ